MNGASLLLVGATLALVLLIAGLIISAVSERTYVAGRLGEYTAEVPQAAPRRERRQRRSSTGPLTEWFNTRVERQSWSENLAAELARANLRLRPGEYVAVMGIGAIIGGLLFWIIGRESFLLGLVGAVLGFFVPRLYVGRLQGQRLQRFNNQLGDTLNLMVNSLRAGFSVVQSLDSISRDMASPTSDEFRRVVQEIQLGLSFDRAMENLLRRIPSEDMDMVVTAIIIQRDTGGNLAEILDNISETIRERVRVKGEIRTLTSQSRLSGQFLALLPVIFTLGIYVMNPQYLDAFFAPESNTPFPIGYAALGVAGLMIIVGYFVMRQLGEVEI
jgi:tight adherence protein B